jgi:hypothetical protein
MRLKIDKEWRIVYLYAILALFSSVLLQYSTAYDVPLKKVERPLMDPTP